MQYDSSLRETGYDKGDRHSAFVKKSTWIKKATPKASGAEDVRDEGAEQVHSAP